METSAADAGSDRESGVDSDANVSIICCYCCSSRELLLLLLLSLTCLLLSKVPGQRQSFFLLLQRCGTHKKWIKQTTPQCKHTHAHSQTHTHTHTNTRMHTHSLSHCRVLRMCCKKLSPRLKVCNALAAYLSGCILRCSCSCRGRGRCTLFTSSSFFRWLCPFFTGFIVCVREWKIKYIKIYNGTAPTAPASTSTSTHIGLAGAHRLRSRAPRSSPASCPCTLDRCTRGLSQRRKNEQKVKEMPKCENACKQTGRSDSPGRDQGTYIGALIAAAAAAGAAAVPAPEPKGVRGRQGLVMEKGWRSGRGRSVRVCGKGSRCRGIKNIPGQPAGPMVRMCHAGENNNNNKSNSEAEK